MYKYVYNLSVPKVYPSPRPPGPTKNSLEAELFERFQQFPILEIISNIPHILTF